MGLFSLTKKPAEKSPEQPSFPKFPDVHEGEMPEFPAYEPTIGEIKKEITKPEEFEVPIRDKRTEQKSMFGAQIEPTQQFTPPKMDFSAPKMPQEGKTLFIKIDKYKEAMHDINSLKTKIAEAERILSNLEEIKTEEDSKLSKWNSEIQEIKEKLLSLDKNLFEA